VPRSGHATTRQQRVRQLVALSPTSPTARLRAQVSMKLSSCFERLRSAAHARYALLALRPSSWRTTITSGK
jgi:hypothetical protein